MVLYINFCITCGVATPGADPEIFEGGDNSILYAILWLKASFGKKMVEAEFFAGITFVLFCEYHNIY